MCVISGCSDITSVGLISLPVLDCVLWMLEINAGCPKIKYLKKLTKIECCGAKFSHGHDLGAFDPA